MTQPQSVMISRSRLQQTFGAALLASLLLGGVVFVAVKALANFSTETEKTLEVQSVFTGSLEASPIAPKVDLLVNQEIFSRLTARENETITVFVSGDTTLGYQVERDGISFWHDTSIYSWSYSPSGTLEVRGSLIIIPMQRSTLGLVIVWVVGVFLFAFVLLLFIMMWHRWYKEYRQRRTYQLNQSV